MAAETGLECSEADLRRILAALMSAKTLWEAVGLAGRPFRLVLAVSRLLEARGLLKARASGLALTSGGRRLCAESGIRPRRPSRCPGCSGTGISLRRFRRALERFEVLAADRPDPLPEFDQAYVTPQTTMARLALMADRGDLDGKDLVVLGDDDLMGLAAALTGLPARVVVLEIDRRLTEFMTEAARSEGLAMEVLAHDLEQQLPADLAASFDTFFTDPPDASNGMKLFVSRAVESLRGAGTSGYFGLTMIESSLYRWRELQDYLVHDRGLVITDVIPDFNTYVNWDYLGATLGGDMEGLLRPPEDPWYRSALYRIEALPGSQRSVDVPRGMDMYVGKESLAWIENAEVDP